MIKPPEALVSYNYIHIRQFCSVTFLVFTSEDWEIFIPQQKFFSMTLFYTVQVTICMPPLKALRTVTDRMKNLGSYLVSSCLCCL